MSAARQFAESAAKTLSLASTVLSRRDDLLEANSVGQAYECGIEAQKLLERAQVEALVAIAVALTEAPKPLTFTPPDGTL